MKTAMVLALSILMLAACGRNPHLVSKDIALETILPSLEPIKVSPQLVLREKVSKKEQPFNFGELKVGDKSTLDLELINVGKDTAKNVKIPTLIGDFNVINIDCGQELIQDEVCHLKIEITGVTPTTTPVAEALRIVYSNASDIFSSSSALVASVKAPTPPVATPQPDLIIIPKNASSGIVYLKDVPLLEERVVTLELRNIGNADAENVQLPTLSSPYKLINQNCKAKLAPTEFCEVNFSYSPVAVKEDKMNFEVAYSDLKVSQLVLANGIKLEAPGKIDVKDGIITQDIYDIIDVKPEMLSPLQEVRGIDLGSLLVNKEVSIKVSLDNSGATAAKIINVKGFQTPQFKMDGAFPGVGGNCTLNLKGTCDFVVKVTPKDLNNIHDLIELTYEDGQGNKRRLSLVLFASVKTESVAACKTILARSSVDQSVALQKLGANYKLPYKLKVGTAALTLLYNTESNKNLRFTNAQGSVVVPSVKNAMVQFGFNISEEELAKYKSVQVELDILKVGTEGAKFDTTEVICLNEVKKCSGTFFIDSNFSHLNTPNYDMYSNFFSSELLRSSQTNLAALKDVLAGKGLVANGAGLAADTIYRLKKKFPLQNLFGKVKGTSMAQGLNFVLADDSHLLTMPKLILESSPADCKL